VNRNVSDPFLTKPATTGLMNFKTRTMPVDAGIQSFPGVYCASSTNLKFMKSLYKRLVVEFPVNEELFSGVSFPGNVSDWKQLFNVAGISPDFCGIPPSDRQFIKTKTLDTTRDDVKHYLKTGKIDPETQKFMLIIASKLLGLSECSAIAVKREANCGTPQMTRDFEVKMNQVEMWNSDFKRLIPLVRKKDWQKLYLDHDVSTAFFNAFRDQHDSFKLDEKSGIYKSKTREVQTCEAVIKVNAKQDPKHNYLDVNYIDSSRANFDKCWEIVDKKIDPKKPRCASETEMASTISEIRDELGIEVSAVRKRQISASSKSSSYPLQIPASMMYNYMCEQFPVLLNDTGSDDLTERFKGYQDVSFWDVKNHDQMAPDFLIDFFLAFIEKNFDTWVYNLAYRSFHPPILIRNDRAGGPSYGMPNWVWIGHLFGPEVNDPGNNSGNSFTSVVAKYLGICLFFGGMFQIRNEIPRLQAFYRRHTLEEAANIVLRNTPAAPSLVCNAGDNISNGFPDSTPEFRKKFPDALPCTRWDQSNDYKGQVRIISDTSQNFSLKLSSFVLKTLLPERSYNNKASWDLGYLEKLKIYSKVPHFSDLIKIVNEEFSKAFGFGKFVVDPEMIAQRSIDNKGVADDTPPISIYDIAFMEDPDVIHYKIDPKWLSPGLFEKVFYSVDVERLQPLIKSMKRSWQF